jgi:hypothetical protein
MSGQVCLTVLDAAYFGTTHVAGMASDGFAEAARLAEAAALRRDARLELTGRLGCEGPGHRDVLL